MTARPEVGLLLLTGGQGARLGGPKHDRPHPQGGSWGGHLVRVFEAVFPGGPVTVIGQGLPDRPDLPALEDPREGPAVALQTWAARGGASGAGRWWVVACDLPRWTPADLRVWWERVRSVDPAAEAWVIAEADGRLQPLGGFLPGHLAGALSQSHSRRLMDLWEALPGRVIPDAGAKWMDVDDPEALSQFLRAPV